MKFERDPSGPPISGATSTGSFLLSLLLHALLAALLFSVLASSSQQGATENVSGGEVVTIQRTSPVAVANQPASLRAAVPVPHVRTIAPLHHAPLTQPQAQRLPVNRHELAKIAPSAPPNPRPIPQQTPATQSAADAEYLRNAPGAPQLPAAPVSMPTVAPVAVAVKPPPTAAPSPAPTSAPTARPSPKPPAPVVRPSARPATPAPAVPQASPTAAAVARATATPRATAAPAARPSVAPAARTGVPNPSPTSTTAVARTAGTAPSPGPSGGASPGPRPGAALKNARTPARPIEIRPTPAPETRVNNGAESARQSEHQRQAARVASE